MPFFFGESFPRAVAELVTGRVVDARLAVACAARKPGSSLASAWAWRSARTGSRPLTLPLVRREREPPHGDEQPPGANGAARGSGTDLARSRAWRGARSTAA